MKKYILLSLIYFTTLTSCLYEDKGNYEYNRLPGLVIEGIETSYGTKLTLVDSIVITPTVRFNGEGDEAYEYTWYQQILKKPYFISNDKDLRLFPTEVGVLYYRFEVKHKKTGLSEFFDTNVTYTSTTERGFYILKQTIDGNTEMDAMFRDGKGGYTKQENIITFSAGAPLQGLPVALDYNKYRWNDKENAQLVIKNTLFPASEEDIVAINTADLNTIATYDDLFIEQMPAKGQRKIKGLSSASNLTTIVYQGADGKNKVRNKKSKDHSTFGFELIRKNDPNIDVDAKFMAMGLGLDGQVVYDRNTGTFRGVRNMSPTFVDYAIKTDPSNPLASLGGKYDLGPHDYDLIYFGQSNRKVGIVNSPYSAQILLKQRVNPDTLILCGMNLNMFSNIGNDVSAMFTMDTLLSKNTLLPQASHYSMHSDGAVLYFVTGENQINQYFLDDKKEIHDVFTASGEISWMKYIDCNYTDASEKFKSLAIATYDRSSDTYTLGLYNIGNSYVPESTPHTQFTGKGRLHSAKYVIPYITVLTSTLHFPHILYY